jgi:hypothetical protein
MGSTDRDWTIHDRGQQFGPHTKSEIAQLVAAGTISEEALVWQDGSPEWVAVSTVVPMPPRIPSTVASGSRRAPNSQIASARSTIKVCVLVSAIGNIAAGALWASTCIGIVLTVPMIALCVFEFILYAKLDDLSDKELADKSHMMAIGEIIVGLFNLVSLVCGIIGLINSNKLKQLSR